MKKILFILVLLFFQSFAFETYNINEFDDFMKSLKLSQKQEVKIDKIKAQYNPQLTKLNAQILLKDMKIAQLKNISKYKNNVLILKQERNDLIDNFYEVMTERDNKILSSLGFFQKRKYKKYMKENSPI